MHVNDHIWSLLPFCLSMVATINVACWLKSNEILSQYTFCCLCHRCLSSLSQEGIMGDLGMDIRINTDIEVRVVSVLNGNLFAAGVVRFPVKGNTNMIENGSINSNFVMLLYNQNQIIQILLCIRWQNGFNLRLFTSTLSDHCHLVTPRWPLWHNPNACATKLW